MGLTPKPRGNVVNYYEGNTSQIISRLDGGKWTSLIFSNDGAASAELVLNDLRQTIQAGEILDEDFVEFDSFEIVSTIAYRVWARE